MVHIEQSHDLLDIHQNTEMKKVIIESRFSASDTEGLVRK